MQKVLRLPLALIALICSASSVSQAQQPAPPAPTEDYFRAHYTKYEFRIPMRDGKRLFTSVYVPKDTATGPYPFLMDRTPYSVAPYGEDQYPKHLGPSEEFEKSGYIFVYQDVRGRWMSEGEFVEMHPHIDDKKSPKDVDDSSDTHDTIDFLLKHVPITTARWASGASPTRASTPRRASSIRIRRLVAASPQAPMTDLFMGDDGYHGGAFMLAANFGFYAPSFYPHDRAADAADDRGLSTSARRTLPVLPECRQHHGGSRQALSEGLELALQRPGQARHLRRLLEGARPVRAHEEREVRGAGGGRLVRRGGSYPARIAPSTPSINSTPIRPRLVEGPWVHGGWARSDGTHLGDVQFNAKTGEYFRANIQFPFFEHYLKGKGAASPRQKCSRLEPTSGAASTVAAEAAAAKTLYFHAGGKLSFSRRPNPKAFRRVCERPRAPGALCGLHNRHRAAALHGGRSALRQLSAGRAGI
jgi:predicted acyl esterase